MIRNNKFTDLAIGANGPQAILQIDPEIPTKTRGNDFHYHNSVTFTGNIVETFDSQIVYAEASERSTSLTTYSLIPSLMHRCSLGSRLLTCSSAAM